MPYQIDDTTFKDLKKDAKTLASMAKNSANKMIEGSTISECDAFKLAFYSGDIEEARGAISILTKTFPTDEDIKHLSREISEIHAIGHKATDTFITECFCRKKI